MATRTLYIGGYGNGLSFVRDILARSGFDLGDERVPGRDGMVSWLMAAPGGSNAPWGPDRGQMAGDFDRIIHIVRAPCAAISAGLPVDPLVRQWIRRVLGLPPGLPDLAEAAAYWEKWNRLCMAVADSWIRLESFPAAYQPMCLDAGLKPRPVLLEEPALPPELPRGTVVTWADLDALDHHGTNRIRCLARALGYTGPALFDNYLAVPGEGHA